jgi:hypothetical protein
MVGEKAIGTFEPETLLETEQFRGFEVESVSVFLLFGLRYMMGAYIAKGVLLVSCCLCTCY